MTTIEVLRTGRWIRNVDWPWTCTRADIAVAARATGDHELAQPIIKVGLSDTPYKFDRRDGHETITNLRVSEDGEALLGDVDALPAMFEGRTRTVECLRDVLSKSGQIYRLAVTAVAVDARPLNFTDELARLAARPAFDLSAHGARHGHRVLLTAQQTGEAT
jgi:hypothetical protein